MMTQSFGVERLIVYQKGMQFAEYRHQLLDGLPRRVAACDHFHRGAESILVNIAHAHSAESAQARLVYLGHANGSASMVLNIAEGNGRFNGVDRGAFCKIAYKATVQTGTLMDLIANERGVDQRFSEEGHERIRRIMTLLSALARAVDHE